LYEQLEAARIEVETMRGVSVHTPMADLPWLEGLGWSGSLLDPAD